MWISLGLCWGQTASVHGKASFPYPEAALRAVSLWTRLTSARVAVTLVQAPQLTAGQLDQLRAYTAQLVSRGAVVAAVPAGELDCVLSSQARAGLLARQHSSPLAGGEAGGRPLPRLHPPLGHRHHRGL